VGIHDVGDGQTFEQCQEVIHIRLTIPRGLRVGGGAGKQIILAIFPHFEVDRRLLNKRHLSSLEGQRAFSRFLLVKSRAGARREFEGDRSIGGQGSGGGDKQQQQQTPYSHIFSSDSRGSLNIRYAPYGETQVRSVAGEAIIQETGHSRQALHTSARMMPIITVS